MVAGDTFEGIAKKHGITVQLLQRLNPKVKDINKIYVNQWLKVPVNIEDKPKSSSKNSISINTYKVQSGDTLSQIAQRSGQSVANLQRLNNISDPNKIQVGTVLVIKNNNKSTPVSTMSKIPSISQANEPWYNSVLDAVSGVEESVKKGGERVIDKVSNGIDSIAEAGEKTYDYVFGDDDKQPSPSNTSSKPSQPSLKSNTQNSKPITNNNTLDLQNEVGNNQNGHPAEQISYGSDTTVYHIYHDGNIKRENGQAIGYAAFIYYDEGGNKHYLGKTEYIKTRRWESKGAQGSGYVYLVCIGGDGKSGGVDDNTISAAEKEKRLSKYRKGNVGYEIHMNSSSQRYFMSGTVIASFLGSLCKLGYDDITFNGASKKDGSPGVSSSHINGKCVDVRYLRTDKAAKKVLLQDPEYDHQRTVRMVETFYEFGWGQAKRTDGSTIKILSEKFINRAAGVTSKTLLPHCSHYNKTRHNNHLHLQGLSPKVEDINVIHRRDEIINSNSTLYLSKQDIIDLIKVTSTEVVSSLPNTAFKEQTAGVVDTILNRVKSGYWGNSFRSVINARRQFSKITGPQRLNPYGSVQNMPWRDVNTKVKNYVLVYLLERENGRPSIIGGHLNYANKYYSDAYNRRTWVDAFHEAAVAEGLILGSGRAIHAHGTQDFLKKYMPEPFTIKLPDDFGEIK